MSNRKKINNGPPPEPERRPAPCPDCSSDVVWMPIGGKWMWWRGHDKTCPFWARKAERVGIDRETLLMGKLEVVEDL